MTRQDVIEELRSRVRHNSINNFDDLKLEISCAEYDGDTIDEIDDILSPIGFNICDKCGSLEYSEDLCWVDYLEEDYDSDLIKSIEKYDIEHNTELCAVCYECVKELRK